ncbi:hypothetical protein SLEP1_g46346 [Rubroshorea leprosula]|uniref:Transporter-associated domain-containing protein n=1 Tax=Rubroshorea leprosula TaxID=152421 RepID=A0AAV5LNP6_9ROSI|nr:hypothetical protein SLEP1_g46346 [Rubroshorea leprosula]
MAPKSAIINRPSFISGSIFGGIYSLRLRRPGLVGGRAHLRSLSEENNDLGGDQGEVLGLNLKSLKILLKQGVFIWAMLCCLLVLACKRVLAVEGVMNAGSITVVLFGLEDDVGFFYVHMVHINLWKSKTGVIGDLMLICVSEPYVTEDELKLMLRGAELSGEIEEEEQDMIEIVLEIKDTRVSEVMTPLVDVVAIDASATLVEFTIYSISVWNLLRELQIKKVHLAIVLNKYGGTIGQIVTLEDVVEEIVGEIFDENDSKEEIQKKIGYIVMRAEGVYDVDANTSIYLPSEDLKIKMPEGHQSETVSGFLCQGFGCIPRAGESIKVVLKRDNQDDDDDKHDEDGSNHQDINNGEAMSEAKSVTQLIPKIMKRKGNGYKLDNITYAENAFQKRQGNRLSDRYVVAEDT